MKQAHQASAPAPAIPTAEITKRERLAQIKAKIAPLLSKAPYGTEHWSVARTCEFKDAICTLGTARSLADALPAAQTIADAYGRSMGEIDPCYGAPA